jgi:chromosome segregation ATPase
MADEHPSEFRFDGDESEPDSFYHEELKDLRVEKLGQRITLLSILLPCLIAVALYVGYRSLSGRIGRSDNIGSQEVERLTKEIDDLSKTFNEKLITFSTTLSTQDKDFGTTIEGRLFGITQSIDKLQKNVDTLNANLTRDLDQSQKIIENLQVSKADKKSLAIAVENINASVKPLQSELQTLKTVRKDLSAVSADIKRLDGKLTRELDAAASRSDQISQNYRQLEASLAELSGDAIDKDALALEMFKIKKNVQRQISEAVSDLDQRLKAIQTRLDRTEDAAGYQKQSMKKASQKAISAPGITAPQSGQSIDVRSKSAETITEKDLIE